MAGLFCFILVDGSKKMRIVLFGYIGHQNFGDLILLDAALEQIPNGSEVAVIHAGPFEDLITKSHETRLKITRPRYGSLAHFNAISRAIKVVCIGGTCFHGRKSGFPRNQQFALLTGKKIEWRNVGLESGYTPTALQKFQFKHSFKNMIVRDEPSYAIAEEKLNITPIIQLDAAFTAPCVLSAAKTAVPKPNSVFVSVRKSAIPLEQKLTAIKEGLERLGNVTDIIVCPACPIDEEICSKVANILKATYVTPNWIDQLDVMASCSAMIAERLHHQVIGHVLGMRTLSIIYMEKCRSVFNASDYEIETVFDATE